MRDLGILAQHVGVGFSEHVAVDPLDHPARGVVAAIEEDGTEDGLQRVGEDRRTAAPAAATLALTDHDLDAEAGVAGKAGERVAIDEVRAQPRRAA